MNKSPNAHTHTPTHFYAALPPAVVQPTGEFGETMPKSACWAGDYNARLPTERPEPAKSCLVLRPPPPHFSLSWGLCCSLTHSVYLYLSTLSFLPHIYIYIVLSYTSVLYYLLPQVLCSALGREGRCKERRDEERECERVSVLGG